MLSKRLSKVVLGAVICGVMVTGMASVCMGEEELKSSNVVMSETSNNDVVKTRMESNVVFASLRDVSNFFKGDFKLNGDEAIVNINGDEIVVNSEREVARVNSKSVSLMTKARMYDDDIYVPLDFLRDNVNARFTYDRVSGRLTLESSMKLQYASGFSVEYFKGGVKKVTDGSNRTLVIVPEGKVVPEEFKNETIIKTPLKNVLATSKDEIDVLKNIGEINSVKEVTKEAVTSDAIEIKMGLQDGVVQYVSKDDEFDFDKISFFSPKLVIVDRTLRDYENIVKKLDELNINYVVENSSLENNQNAKNEWGKFISVFYDKE